MATGGGYVYTSIDPGWLLTLSLPTPPKTKQPTDYDIHRSGAILHSETLGQKAADSTPFPELLKAKGVLPGVKVSQSGCN